MVGLSPAGGGYKSVMVFLSYNSQDERTVAEVCKRLTYQGITDTWFATSKLAAGSDWLEGTQHGIAEAHTMLVFFSGNGIGPWQNEEIKAAQIRQKRSELNIIPVILSGHSGSAKLPEFLASKVIVDFRLEIPDPFEFLVRSITGDPSRKVRHPKVVLSPTLSDPDHLCKKLCDYCRDSAINIRWPNHESPKTLQQAFLYELSDADLFVQIYTGEISEPSREFPEGREKWFLDRALESSRTIGRVLWHHPDLFTGHVTDRIPRSLLQNPDVKTWIPALFHQEVVARANYAFEEISAADQPSAEGARTVMVKYRPVDTRPTNQLVHQLAAENIRCRSAVNGTPFLERMRDVPFDGIIIVLGDNPDEWTEHRGEELLAVEQSLKDQAPIRAYYRISDTVPPFVGPDVLQINGEAEISNLIRAIHERPRAS